MPHTVFIADLHLKLQDRRTLQSAAAFFESLAGSTDQLFILGDLVEYWIGDDAYDGKLDPVFGPLSKLQSNGCQTYLMHGNRDFLLGEHFVESLGLTLIRDDQFILDTGGHKVLLMHGDTLCTDDVDYQAMRRQLRSTHWQKDFLAKTIEERLNKAQQLRNQSVAETNRKSDEICDVNQRTVEETMTTAGVMMLLHGHTHRPAHHQFKLPANKTGKVKSSDAHRWVLGDWQATDIIYAVSNDKPGSDNDLPVHLAKWAIS